MEEDSKPSEVFTSVEADEEVKTGNDVAAEKDAGVKEKDELDEGGEKASMLCCCTIM